MYFLCLAIIRVWNPAVNYDIRSAKGEPITTYTAYDMQCKITNIHYTVYDMQCIITNIHYTAYGMQWIIINIYVMTIPLNEGNYHP